jgi:hypothetical protein
MKHSYFLFFICFSLIGVTKAQDSTQSSFSNFSYEKVDTNTVTFQWNIVGEQPLYYVLETYNYSFAMNDWFPYADIEGNKNSYRLRNIPIGAQSYRLRAVYENDFLLSDSITFTIAPYKFLQSYYSYSPNESGKISIHWKVSGISPSYYKLIFNNNELIIPDSINSYDFHNLTANSTYTYSLTAVYSNNEELHSGNQLLSAFNANLSSIVRDSAQIRMADTIMLSKLLWSYHYYDPNQSGKISICWKPLGISPAYYQLTFNEIQLILPDSILKYDFLNLATDTTYSYTLTAFDANNQQLQIESQSIYIPRMNDFLQIPIDSIRASRIVSASMATNSTSPIMNTSTQNIDPNAYGHLLHGIQAYICEYNRVMLVWNFPEGEEFPPTELHYIFRNDECIAILPGNTLGFIDGPLPPGRYVYEYLNFSVNGDFTKWPLTEFILSEHTPPNFSGNFNFNIADYYLTGNNVVINWTSEGEHGIIFYNIFRNNECIARISNDAHEYIDKDLPPGIYRYSVWATTHLGQWIEAENAPHFNITRVPLSPTNFTYTIQNDTNAKLNWRMSVNGLTPTYYRIQRNGEYIATISGSTLTYTDQSLLSGTYTYRLFAHFSTGEVLEAGNSLSVEIEEIIVYALPTNVNYNMINNDVILTWDTIPAGGNVFPSFYQIKRNGMFVWDLPPHKCRYYDSDVDAGTCSYELFAHYLDGTQLRVGEPLAVTVNEWKKERIYSLPDNYSYSIDNNTINFSRETQDGEVLPISYQIERNGEIIKEFNGNFSYTEIGLYPGDYIYYILEYYSEVSAVVINGPVRVSINDCD